MEIWVSSKLDSKLSQIQLRRLRCQGSCMPKIGLHRATMAKESSSTDTLSCVQLLSFHNNCCNYLHKTNNPLYGHHTELYLTEQAFSSTKMSTGSWSLRLVIDSPKSYYYNSNPNPCTTLCINVGFVRFRAEVWSLYISVMNLKPINNNLHEPRVQKLVAQNSLLYGVVSASKSRCLPKKHPFQALTHD
jgi:hypothetical protein